jgi:hypothetical protein
MLSRVVRPLSGRHKFSREEDDHLKSLIDEYGDRSWALICRSMPGRNARQCRHRYYNYLIDAHQQVAWTDEEERLIYDKFCELGPKWVQISGLLRGRTGNDVKNRWHKHIAKRHVQRATEPDEDDQRPAPPSEHERRNLTPPSFIAGPALSVRLGKAGLSAFLQDVLN